MKQLPHFDRRGFTLLELLVVISIIGILITMGTVAFSTAQQRGRDAKRRADAKAVQGAFEQYYVENSSVYSTCATMSQPPYMQGGLPTDPRNASPHVYACANTASTYCFCTLLEADGAGNSSTSTCSYTTGTTADYFCISQLQ